MGSKALTFIHSLARKSLTKGQGSGITKIPSAMQAEAKASEIFTNLVEAGLKPEMMDDFIKSEADVAKYLNILDAYKANQLKNTRAIAADSPEGKKITEALFGKRGEVVDMKGNVIPEGSGIMGGESIESLMKSGDVTKGTVTKKSKKVTDRDMFRAANQRLGKPKTDVNTIIKNINSMEPIDAMKEANKVIKREGPYKNLNQQQAKKILEDTEDHIFERDVTPMDEDFASGGRVGLRGGGADMGAGSSKSSKSSGPAGGASSGGNYGGNKNSGSSKSSKSSGPAGGASSGGNYGGNKNSGSSKSSKSSGPAGGASSGGNYGGNKNKLRNLAIKRAEQMISPDDAMNQYDIETPETDFFSGPAYNKYNEARTDAYANAPSKFDYDIRANEAAGQFIQDQITGSLGDNKLGRFVGDAAALASVPFAIFGSPFHEATQVVSENRMEPGSGITGFAKAFMNEQPISTAINRGAGVLQSTALGKGIYNLGGNLYNLKEKLQSAGQYQTGGVAGLLGERTGYAQGTDVFRRQKKEIPEEIKKKIFEMIMGTRNLGKVIENSERTKSRIGSEGVKAYGLAEGGRTGYKEGLTAKQFKRQETENLAAKINEYFDIKGSGSKSGKNQIMGAPDGITADTETFNAIINMDIPIKEKINLLGSFGFGKDRFKVEKGDEELFLGEGGYKDRNIGLGFNQGGEGFSGSVIRNLERGDNDYQVKFLKKFASGGRVGLAGGMTRRAFLKLMGGVAAGIGAVKSGIISSGKKGATKKVVKEVIKTPNAPGKPEWFDALVNKVILEGDDVTKKLAIKDRQTVHTKKIDNDSEVTVYRNLDDDSVRVEYNSPDVMLDEPVSLTVKPGQADETIKKAPPAEFETYEQGFVARSNGPDDYSIDPEPMIGNSIKDLETDVTKLKEFATGEKQTLKEFVQSKKRKDKVKKINQGDIGETSDYVTKRQGDYYPEYDDYASGGIAGMLGE
jgi:hypothetical protein